ncbi:MAG: hypothetical protein KDA75_08115 [Planctomycetaceae bacterium]|nr:hypothetical protein [Planctomycetaceae bacterium]
MVNEYDPDTTEDAARGWWRQAAEAGLPVRVQSLVGSAIGGRQKEQNTHEGFAHNGSSGAGIKTVAAWASSPGVTTGDARATGIETGP